MTTEGDGAPGSALDAVAEASRALTAGGTLQEALASIAAAAASATGAEVAVARVLDPAAREAEGSDGVLGLAGGALAAGWDELRTAEQVTMLAAEGTGALGSLLWRTADGDAAPELLGSFGVQPAEPELAGAGEAAGRAL